MNKIKYISLILLGIIVLAYILGMFSTQSLRTEIVINASPKIVWSHLVNFEKHSEWNPFIKKISGKLVVGEQLEVTIQPPQKDPMDFQPILLVVEENKELRWLGSLLIPKLFDGEHYFILNEMPQGKTKLEHGENFSGILAFLLWSSMEQDTKNGFEAMNRAIKGLSETTITN